MSASPVAMSAAERQQRRRAKLIDPAALEAKDIARRILDAVSPEKAELIAAMLNHRIGRDLIATAAPSGPPGADYPRMLYHPDGRTYVVETAEDHDRLKFQGWEIAPLDVHRQRPVTSHGALVGTDNPFARPLPRW